MTPVNLNFINQSNDTNNTQVIIFQKESGAIWEQSPTWKIIIDTHKGGHHSFEFDTKGPQIICIQVAANAAGEMKSPAIGSDINTEISLLGITSADIIMTGGGEGAASTPFNFNLSNVVCA